LSQLRPLPTAIEGPTGALVRAAQRSVSARSSAHSESGTVPPPITIQSVSADDKGYTPTLVSLLPCTRRVCRSTTTAVSLSDPEANTISATSCRRQTRTGKKRRRPHPYLSQPSLPVPIISAWRRQTRTALGPAHPRNMAFTICRLGNQTVWFRLLCVASFCGIPLWLYRLRSATVLRVEESNFAKHRDHSGDGVDRWTMGLSIHESTLGWSTPALSQLGTVGEVGKDAIIRRIWIEVVSEWAQALPAVSRSRMKCASVVRRGVRWFLIVGVPLETSEARS